jgi:hypothetical protein
LVRVAAEREAYLALATLRRLSLIDAHAETAETVACASKAAALLLASELGNLDPSEMSNEELVSWGRLVYRRAFGKYVAQAAVDAGDRLLKTLVPSIVLDAPRRLGVLRTSVADMIAYEDWMQLIVEHLEELPKWNEGQFGRWLGGLVEARRPRRRRLRPPIRLSSRDHAVRSSFFGGASQWP